MRLSYGLARSWFWTPSLIALIAVLSLGMVACSSSKDEPDPVAVPNYGPSAGTSAKAGRRAPTRRVARAPRTTRGYAGRVQAPTYTYSYPSVPQGARPVTTYAYPQTTYAYPHAAHQGTGTYAGTTTYGAPTYRSTANPSTSYPALAYPVAAAPAPTYAAPGHVYPGYTSPSSRPAPTYPPATTGTPATSHAATASPYYDTSPYYGAGTTTTAPTPNGAATAQVYPASPPPPSLGYATPGPTTVAPAPTTMPPNATVGAAPRVVASTPTPTSPQPATTAPYTPPVPVSSPAPAQPAPASFRWYHRWSEAQAAARQSGRHILVLSTKPDCKICEYFKDTTVPQTEDSLRSVAVGYINEILSPEVVAVDNILRDNLPTAKFMPLVGFLTADMQWVHGFSGKRTPDQFRSDIQRIPAMRSYASAPTPPRGAATHTAQATGADPMLPPPSTYADIDAEKHMNAERQRERGALAIDQGKTIATRTAEAEAAFREGAEAVVNEFGETEWNNPEDVWPGQDSKQVARAPEPAPSAEEPRGVFASSSQGHEPVHPDSEPVARVEGLAPPPLPVIPGITHPYGDALPVEAPVDMDPSVRQTTPPNAPPPAPDAEPVTRRRTSSRADAWAHEMLQGALEDIRRGKYDRARGDLLRVRRRMPHTAAAREAAKGAIAIHNARRIETARTTSEQRLYLNRARRDLGNSYWSSLFSK